MLRSSFDLGFVEWFIIETSDFKLSVLGFDFILEFLLEEACVQRALVHIRCSMIIGFDNLDLIITVW